MTAAGNAVRIVDVCGFYSPHGGGVKTYVDRKLRAAHQYGHDLTVIVPGEADGLRQVGPRSWLRSIASPRFPLDTRYCYFQDEPRLHAELDRLAPDFVECGTPWASAAMVERWPAPVPRSLVMHLDVFATYPYRWLGGLAETRTIDRPFEFFWRRLRRLGSHYDAVVCANRGLVAQLVDHEVPNVVFEPMGVDPGRFSPDLRDAGLRAALLASLHLPADATLLLGVGRFSPEKRWPMIARAVTAAGYRQQLGLLLVGEGRDRARIERVIAGNPHVRVLDAIRDRSELARLMASADALVHGSESESFGMVGAEARASGLPVIVPDRGGCAEQAAGGMGWTYRAGDRHALAALLGEVAGAPLDECRARSALAAPFVRTMDQHFAELFARYAAIASQRRRAA